MMFEVRIQYDPTFFCPIVKGMSNLLDQEPPVVCASPGAVSVLMNLINRAKGHVGQTDERVEHHAQDVAITTIGRR